LKWTLLIWVTLRRQHEEGERRCQRHHQHRCCGSGSGNLARTSASGKFRHKEHFGRLYGDIFEDLNAAQVLLAVLIFRAVENERKRPASSTPPDYMPYASYYISMLIGRKLLADSNVSLTEVSHRNFKEIRQVFEENQVEYHASAVDDVADALKACYRDGEISLQQLSATFRCGDLLEMLEPRE